MLTFLRKRVADYRDRLRGQDPFDIALGVDTAGIIRLVDTQSPNRIHGHRYQPCDPIELRWAVETANLDWTSFSFADIGCGKGRALVVASQFAFRKIIGVDYSAPFIETSRNNLLRVGVPETRFELYCQDGTTFRFRPEPTFLFLYNPFTADLLNALLLHAKEDVLDRGLPLVVNYQGPRPQEVAVMGWARKVAQRATTSLFFTDPLRTGKREP